MKTYEEGSSRENSVSVSEGKGSTAEFANLTPGAYEAKYNGLRVFDDKTEYGPKKRCRLFFIITRGKFKDMKASFRGNYMQDRESKQWFIGAKSDLAKAIRVVSGGGKTIDDSHIGTPVCLVVGEIIKKDGTVYTKKDGSPFYAIIGITPRNDDAAGGDTDPAKAPASQVATPPAQTPDPVPAKAQAPAQSVAVAEKKPEQKKEEAALMDELSSLSDFSE